MKYKIFVIIAFLLPGLNSCEKIEFKKDISGRWQFDGAGGGIFGGWYKDNTFSHLELKKSNRYYIYNFDTLKAKGDYVMKESENKNNWFEPYYLNFFTTDYLKISFPFNQDLDVTIIHNDTLLLSERNIDGLSYYFTRK